MGQHCLAEPEKQILTAVAIIEIKFLFAPILKNKPQSLNFDFIVQHLRKLVLQFIDNNYNFRKDNLRTD